MADGHTTSLAGLFEGMPDLDFTEWLQIPSELSSSAQEIQDVGAHALGDTPSKYQPAEIFHETLERRVNTFKQFGSANESSFSQSSSLSGQQQQHWSEAATQHDSSAGSRGALKRGKDLSPATNRLYNSAQQRDKIPSVRSRPLPCKQGDVPAWLQERLDSIPAVHPFLGAAGPSHSKLLDIQADLREVRQHELRHKQERPSSQQQYSGVESAGLYANQLCHWVEPGVCNPSEGSSAALKAEQGYWSHLADPIPAYAPSFAPSAENHCRSAGLQGDSLPRRLPTGDQGEHQAAWTPGHALSWGGRHGGDGICPGWREQGWPQAEQTPPTCFHPPPARVWANQDVQTAAADTPIEAPIHTKDSLKSSKHVYVPEADNGLPPARDLLALLDSDGGDERAQGEEGIMSPSKQESVSGQNSGFLKAQCLDLRDNKSETAQESMVGNPSHKKDTGTNKKERSKKLILQLTPLHEGLKVAMLNNGLNSGLELVCRAKKELGDVLSHLQRKWQATCPGAVWPEGEFALRLYPTPATPILAGASWGLSSLPGGLTIHDLHVAMGSPELLPLHYAWHRVDICPPKVMQQTPSAQPQAPQKTPLHATSGHHETPAHLPHSLKRAAGPQTDDNTPTSRAVHIDFASPDMANQQIMGTCLRASSGNHPAPTEVARRFSAAARRLVADDTPDPSSNHPTFSRDSQQPKITNSKKGAKGTAQAAEPAQNASAAAMRPVLGEGLDLTPLCPPVPGPQQSRQENGVKARAAPAVRKESPRPSGMYMDPHSDGPSASARSKMAGWSTPSRACSAPGGHGVPAGEVVDRSHEAWMQRRLTELSANPSRQNSAGPKRQQNSGCTASPADLVCELNAEPCKPGSQLEEGEVFLDSIEQGENASSTPIQSQSSLSHGKGSKASKPASQVQKKQRVAAKSEGPKSKKRRTGQQKVSAERCRESAMPIGSRRSKQQQRAPLNGAPRNSDSIQKASHAKWSIGQAGEEADRAVLRESNTSDTKADHKEANQTKPKLARKRHGENVDPKFLSGATGGSHKESAISSKKGSNLESPTRTTPSMRQSPGSVNLKIKGPTPEDKTCDGFENWATLSRQRKQAAQNQLPQGEQPAFGTAHQQQEDGAMGYNADASLEPWARSLGTPGQSGLASIPPGIDPQAGGPNNDDYQFPAQNLPEDLTIDFEAFLDGNDFLAESNATDGLLHQADTLFPELFATM